MTCDLGLILFIWLSQFNCYSITVVPIFPLCLLHPSHLLPPTPTVGPHTVAHVHVSFTHILWLVPSPSFPHCPPSPSPLVTFSLFHVSTPVFLFCSLVYFVPQILLIGEILHDRILHGRKKEGIPNFCNRMEPENVMLSKISQSVKDKYHMVFSF